MNSNIALGWSIAALAILGLIVFIRSRNKNRDKKILAPLLSFARENNSEISYFDTWDKTLIGLGDKENNSLFFIRNIPEREIREKINLSEVSECRMLKTERKVKYGKETVIVTDRIVLAFSFYKHKPEVCLEFYNSDYDELTLCDELQLALKWTGMIKSIANTNREWKDNETGKNNESIFLKQVFKSKIAKNKKEKRPFEKEFSF
ncbi:MAG: hypothetical protein JXA91_04830 [Candidatus Thermoplasmatota archaeon]|nr:hypothetical protein [Candidatus Thermoplasmatota archaeon]